MTRTSKGLRPLVFETSALPFSQPSTAPKLTLFCHFYKKCYDSFSPYRLTVRTSAFQAGNPGSIPGGVTKRNIVEITITERFCGSQNRAVSFFSAYGGSREFPKFAPANYERTQTKIFSLRSQKYRGRRQANHVH